MKNVVSAERPKIKSNVDVTRSLGSFGQDLVGAGINLAFGALGSEIGASISDRYNQKSEERMDKRNRALLLDTPRLTAEGRRRAGLNPYGDPILPGMSSQSSVDSSNVAPDAFYRSQQMTLQERVAMRQLENETLVAESQANRNNAEADRLRGQEGRDVELFPTIVRNAIANAVGQEKANEYQEVVNYVANMTAEDKVSESRYSVSILKENLSIARETLKNLEKDGKLKDEELNIMKNQVSLLEGQIFQQEIANTLGVFKYEQFTGKDYYTGERVGVGLAQLEYDEAYYRADIAKFERDLKEKDFNNYDISFILDKVLDVVTIADIINDDIFSWMSEKERRDLERELTKYKSRERRRESNNFNNMSLFRVILPFIIKKMFA